MSLKSIRENYSKLIAAFAATGIKLTESQKTDLDTFILALEAKMDETKQATVKATKKIVENKMHKEYQKVFESILNHKAENAELAGKIQNKIAKINESKKIVRKVSDYLDMYVESVLPKKTIVDYDRMQKLEQIHESLKDILVVNEDSVESKKAQLKKTFESQKKDLETQIAKLQVKLNESMKKTMVLNNQIEHAKAIKLLEAKVADLPDAEAKQIKRRFANATVDEINAKFKKVYESVKADIEEEAEKDELSLEAEINNIIKDSKLKENDPTKIQAKRGAIHNAHIEEKEDEEVKENDPTAIQAKRGAFHNVHVEAEDAEVDESDDDVELEESEKINASQMARWIEQLGNIDTSCY